MFYDESGYYVVDNFIPKVAQDALEKLLLGNQFPYFYNSTSNGEERQLNTVVNRNTFDHSQFVHQLIWNYEDQSSHKKKIVDLFLPSLNEFFGCDDYKIFRTKINLNTHHPRTRKIIMPHSDVLYDESWSMVYYVNTVPNSYTLIGKELFEEDSHYPNKFTVKHKSESKKGRAIFFDSRRYHSAGKCPEGYIRCVVNMIVDEDKERPSV